MTSSETTYNRKLLQLNNKAASETEDPDDDRAWLEVVNDLLILHLESGTELTFAIASGGTTSTDLLALGAATTLTIATGAVTATKSYHIIAAESGAADDLDTITAAANRTLLLIQADAGDTITVTQAGNITLSGGASYALTGNATLLLFWNTTLNKWTDTNLAAFDAGKIVSGTLANARVNFAAPAAIGSGTPAAGTFTVGTLAQLVFTASTELTIASGAITAGAKTFYTVDTESDAASDDLDTINGGAAGELLIIRANNAGRTVVVTTAGNIVTPDGNSISLDETYKILWLIYDGDLSKWVVFGGGGGGADASAIHDNVAGEINAISAKGSPVGADIVIIEDSADSFNKKKATLTNLAAAVGADGRTPQGYLKGWGIGVTASGGTTATVQPGHCRNDDDTYTIIKTTTTTLDISTTGAGALDAGSPANSTWYYVYAIAKSSDGTTSVLASTGTSPTMPSGYDKKRHIGFVLTNGSAQLREMSTKKDGDYIFVLWSENTLATPFRILSATNLTQNTWTDLDLSGAAPPGCRLARALLWTNTPSTTGTWSWREKGLTNQQLNVLNGDGAVTTNNGVLTDFPLDTSRIGQLFDNNIAITDDLFFDVHGYWLSLSPAIVGASGANV